MGGPAGGQRDRVDDLVAEFLPQPLQVLDVVAVHAAGEFDLERDEGAIGTSRLRPWARPTSRARDPMHRPPPKTTS